MTIITVLLESEQTVDVRNYIVGSIDEKAQITTVSDDESSIKTPITHIDPKHSRALGSESGR